MDKIGPEQFKKSHEELQQEKASQPEPVEENNEISDSEFQKLLDELNDPVQAQRKMAVQIKHFLDRRIKAEISEKGILSDHTRRWVESYNSMLEKIQKALSGDKNVNLHLHKVSHSDIASKIREANRDAFN